MVQGAARHAGTDLPTEDFEAALSYVPVEPIEDDLFAGIPDVDAGDALATRPDLEIAYDGRQGAPV